jgi:rod shape-determining protein MreD
MWQYRWWMWVLLFAAALVVQTALLPLLFPAGYVPNVVLVVVIALALFETPWRGAALGAVAGLMVDVTAGRLIGMNLAIDGLVGYFVATMQGQIVRDAVFVPGMVGAFCLGAVRLVDWGVLRLVGYDFAFRAFMAPLATDILFGLFMTGAVIGILNLKPRREVDHNLRFGSLK